jgi:hypothetical protein
MIDLERPRLRELKTSIAQSIPCDPKEVRPDLRAMTLPSLLILFIGWRDRFIAPRPRKVLTWDRFLRDDGVKQHFPAIQKLQCRIAAGEDLTPFLSKDIARYGYVRPKIGNDGKRRGVEWRDKDYALNAYGVHHLHLSDRIRRNGWSRRTEELLYISFDRESAFLVMVGDHDSFDDGSLAEAVAEMRAASGEEIKGISGTEYTSAERNVLQRHGFATVAQVGDKVVLGAVLSSAGTSFFHTRHADRILLTIAANELLLDQEQYVRPWFESAGRGYPAAPEFLWMLDYCDLCVLEKTTGTAFRLLEWCR